jgi:hypothetical protein
MAIHEAGHKILYERFGGSGEAVITKKRDGKGGEVIWGGQFRMAGDLALTREILQKHGIDPGIELPKNWEVLVGMAGLVAEEIFRGENDDPLFIADEIRERIMGGEVSDTDLQFMRIEDISAFELTYTDVELVWRYLKEDWELVEEEAGILIEEVLDAIAE